MILPSLNVGGMERVMIELARYFVSHSKFEVHLIVMTSYDFFYNPLSSVKVYKPDFSFKNGSRIINQLKTLLFVRARIKEIKPDYVLSFGEMYNSFVLLSTLGITTKVFVSDRSKPDKSWGLFHNFLRKVLYKNAYGIISQTNYSKEILSRMLRHDNIRVIPNPLSINPENSRGDTSRENVILSVGRLIESKRFDLLIKAFSNISTRKNWKLWIVGDGPKMEELGKLIESLGIGNDVILFGKQQDVSYYLNRSKLFAFTSVSEGFPNVLIEALAHGLPVVSFDCVAGPSDIIQEGVNGFLLQELDVNGFTLKLESLMSNPSMIERMQQNALQSAQRFDPELIGESYYNFITYEKKSK